MHDIGWSDTWDAWLGPDRLRPASPLSSGANAFKPGDLVEVHDHGSWRRAVIRETGNGQSFLHYDCGDPALDVGISPGNVRPFPP